MSMGENVTLVIHAPIGLKRTYVSYGWLWWFVTWPIFVVILLIYLLILIWRIRVKNVVKKTNIDKKTKAYSLEDLT